MQMLCTWFRDAFDDVMGLCFPSHPNTCAVPLHVAGVLHMLRLETTLGRKSACNVTATFDKPKKKGGSSRGPGCWAAGAPAWGAR